MSDTIPPLDNVDGVELGHEQPSILMNRADEDGVVDLVDRELLPPPVQPRRVLRSSHSEDSMDVMIPPDMVAEDDRGHEVDEDEDEYDEYEDSEDDEDDHSSYGGEEHDHECGEEEEEEEEDDEVEADEADDDEIQEHLEGSLPDTKESGMVNDLPRPDSVPKPTANAPERGASASPPNNINKNASSSPHTPNVVHDRGLDFDLNEPWQRSLLRQFQTHYDQPRVRSPAVLMAVGHTESRDFAVDVVRGSMRDDLTLTTESSGSIPYHRPQVIHRPWIYNDDHHSALFEDDSTADPHHHHHHSPRPPKAPGGGGAAASERVSPRSHREERDASAAAANYYRGSDRYYYDVPTNARDAGMQAKRSLLMHHHQQSPPWLEMEAPSMGGGTAATGGGGAHDDLDDATTVALASSNQDACFCMGYNVLDFWMPPQTTGTSRGRSRKGGSRQHASSRRIGGGGGGGRRHSVLGKVAEEGSAEVGGADPRPIIHPLPSSSRSVARSDPDGAYNSHQYTTTTTSKTTAASTAR